MEVNEILKKLRLDAGLTQSYVANELKMSQGNYFKYESGAMSPTVDVLKSVCKIYKIDLVDFFSIGIQSEPIKKKVQITLEANNEQQLDKINQILNNL